MGVTKITPEMIDKVVELYQSGKTIRLVGKELRVSHASVRRFLRERGVASRPAHRVRAAHTYLGTERQCRQCSKSFIVRDYWKCYTCRHCYTSTARYKLYRLKEYNLTAGAYFLLLEQQDHACAGCKEPFGDKTPNIDPCHKTNTIRGLLCSGCNTALGLAKDSPKTLRNLATYLEDARYIVK